MTDNFPSDTWKLRRGEPRVVLKLPITLEGKDKLGEAFVEETFTENVSRNGACVETIHPAEVGALLTVGAFQERFRAQARVAIVWSRRSAAGKLRVGLRFVEPSQNWIVR